MAAAWTALAIATAFFVFEFIARVEPSLAAHAIGQFYDLKPGAFGTLSSLFFWIYAPMQIVVGLLLDRYGARRFVLLGSFCCALGVTAFAATSLVGLGAAGRALTGFGASFAFVAALYVANHWFAPERFALLSGGVNGAGMIGTAIGAPLLTSAIDGHGWQSVFLSTGAAGFAIFVVALLFLRTVSSPAQSATTGPLEHVGQTLRIVMASPRIWLISVIGLLAYMPVNVYGGLWGETQLTAERGMTAVQAADGISLLFWGLAAGSVASGYIADRLGNRRLVFLIGTIAAGVAYGGVLYLPKESVYAIDALLFAAGFFNGAQMLSFTMAKEGERNAVAGTVIAFVNMIGIAGALIFQPLVGYLADISGGDYRFALTSIPVCMALSALLLFAGLREHRHPDHLPGARAPVAVDG